MGVLGAMVRSVEGGGVGNGEGFQCVKKTFVWFGCVNRVGVLLGLADRKVDLVRGRVGAVWWRGVSEVRPMPAGLRHVLTGQQPMT